jgi:hypothetical protein
MIVAFSVEGSQGASPWPAYRQAPNNLQKRKRPESIGIGAMMMPAKFPVNQSGSGTKSGIT